MQGDDAFDEEMGGVSQMIAATTAMAVQNIYSSEEEASYEEDDADLKQNAKQDAKPDTKPSSKIPDEKSSATSREKTGNKATAATENSDSEVEVVEISKTKSDDANNLMSPGERSTGTQSVGSLEGLRTQHEPTPKMSKRAAAPAKFSLMGVSFDKSAKKKEPEKKSSGLYIPNYSKDN